MRVTRMTMRDCKMRATCHCKMRATCLGGRGPYRVVVTSSSCYVVEALNNEIILSFLWVDAC